MIISCTGHRPEEVGGYKIPNPIYNFIFDSTVEVFSKLKPTKIIVGGALGFDSWAAIVAINLQIPFEAYIPFVGQENIWPQKSKDEYYELLAKANKKVIVCEGGYAPFKMELRNRAMVDQLTEPDDILLACWNGKEEGGTWNCIQYAIKQKKRMVRIDPLKMTITDLENK